MYEEEADWSAHPLIKGYKDRGLLKWQGFFLSDHTETIAKDKRKTSYIVAERPQMDEGEIGNTLATAFANRQEVSVQKKETDINGYYDLDIVGLIQGFDEEYIYIGDAKIQLDEIRNVEVKEFIKWSKLS
jgi:hypothetical protein